MKEILNGEALYEALAFIKKDLGFSNFQIATILRLSRYTINRYFRLKNVSLGKSKEILSISRVSDFIAIHQNLFSMFSNRENRLAWLNTAHPVLTRKPLDIIIEDECGLRNIRIYLDAMIIRGA